MGFNLDIGCGSKKMDGFKGMDKRLFDDVELFHDIEEFPWPIESEAVDKINASHILEHIKPWKIFDLMDECWRVLSVDGGLNIRVPYGLSYKIDPSHCIEFSIPSFWYFDKEKDYYKTYEPKPWKIIHSVANPDNFEIHVIMQKVKE